MEPKIVMIKIKNEEAKNTGLFKSVLVMVYSLIFIFSTRYLKYLKSQLHSWTKLSWYLLGALKAICVFLYFYPYILRPEGQP
jgi:hypothetical protein